VTEPVNQQDVASLYRSYGGELWRALLVVSAGRADLAEEATAEAFARYLVHRDRVREPRGWLYRTGFRVVVAELHQEQRARAEDRTAVAEEKSLSQDLLEVLATLTPEQRLVMFCAYYLDLPHGEIARLTGTSVAGVKMRLHRARKVLREQLWEGAYA
jgi:RNA polymerase sigma factor (sigma-70 family)